jgi:transposase-like protein
MKESNDTPYTWTKHIFLVCPKCKTKKDILKKDLKIGQTYKCTACDYSGAFTPQE